jgi:hypothetical protein
MNQVNQPQKDRVMKSLAILGFLGVIALGVWLAVQIVSLMPQAFNSLASIADGVYNYQGDEELVVNTDNSTINSGENFSINWNEISTNGTYTFTYACTDGVSVKVTDNTGTLTSVNCDESLTLGNSATDLEVTIESERNRSSEVPYTLAFIAQGESDPLSVSENTITVLNPNIPDDNDVVVIVDDNDTEDDAPAETPTTPSQPEDDPKDTPNVNQPVFKETIVLTTPVSDPNGYVDLAVKIVAVGHLDSNGNFLPRGNIDSDARGAFQFEVKNIGTKTSNDWTFEAILTSGSKYQAPSQNPLKPQERVVFTLGYDDIGNDGISMIGATIKGGNDTNVANNSFTWAVSVVE